MRKGMRGFTLVELAVVMAILGVLATVTVPMLNKYISGAVQRAYEADQAAIQQAVDAYFTASDNPRYLGMRQYPIIGQQMTGASLLKKTSAFTSKDDGDPVAAGVWNPLGGTQGADIQNTWQDGGGDVAADGVRTISDTSTDTWGSVKVTYSGVDYYVDARQYFIDFNLLGNYLKDTPASAASDNTTGSDSLTGSYIWYVDQKGRVKSHFWAFPVSTKTGFQGVHP